MPLAFAKAAQFKPGMVFSLLAEGWAEIWDDELARKIGQFDKEASDNPETVGACTFVTTLDGTAVGMFSWDPRKGPEMAIIGWNCVLPRSRGTGIGKAQIREMLRRFRLAGFRKAVVTTGENPFFLPAQRMYLACGFVEVRRHNDRPDQRYGSIDYQLEL